LGEIPLLARNSAIRCTNPHLATQARKSESMAIYLYSFSL
jgi:hypothetical protein